MWGNYSKVWDKYNTIHAQKKREKKKESSYWTVKYNQRILEFHESLRALKKNKLIKGALAFNPCNGEITTLNSKDR